jgi:hypothetical protein
LHQCPQPRLHSGRRDSLQMSQWTRNHSKYSLSPHRCTAAQIRPQMRCPIQHRPATTHHRWQHLRHRRPATRSHPQSQQRSIRLRST